MRVMGLFWKQKPVIKSVIWKAGYGWEWQKNTELDEVQEFDTWVEAQHWLRLRIAECTTRNYSSPRMRANADYRWVSPIGLDFCLWKVTQ